MEGIYESSASEKVRAQEEELKKELKELQNEIEEGNFLRPGQVKALGSVPLPKDIEHFRRERKLAVSKTLTIREAQPLINQSEVMREEMETSVKSEYSPKSIPLLLHQFFSDRIEHLVQCKHMHMLRWARFNEHSKAIENLYPAYQQRLSHIMEEYHDAFQRARRLAVAREASLAGSESAMGAVTIEDLLIYTRWLVCYMHSVKRMHSFLRVIEWLPVMHKNTIKPQEIEKDEPPLEVESKPSGPPSRARGNLKRIMSQVAITAHLNVLRPMAKPDASLPPPPPLSLSPYQLVSATNPSVAAAAAASGGGLASNEVHLVLPMHETNLPKLMLLLEFLMSCYSVDMDIHQINTNADEMDLFTMVTRRFKKVFSKQEQLRTFPIYDTSVEELGVAKVRSQGALYTFKQTSNWLPFIMLRPEKDSNQIKAMAKLKQQGQIDELLKSHSRFLHIQDSSRVIHALREHAKAVIEPPKPLPASVTTHRTQNDTAAVWKKIFTYASSSVTRDDVLEFDTKVSDEDLGGSDQGGFDLGTAVELLGLEDDNAKNQGSMLQGAYMSFLLLRHLRLRDLQRTCLGILNYFRSVQRTMTINDGGLSLEGGKQRSSKYQVFHGGGISGIGNHQYVHNTPADYRVDQAQFMEFSELENHDDFYSQEEGRVHVQDQRGYYITYDSALDDFKNLETELLLVASHFITKDKEFRNPKPSAKYRGDHLDIASYSHQQIDRFAVLLDLWTNEAAYLENKRQLLDCYFEAYQHVFDASEKKNLAQVMTNVVSMRPRFDFTADYFVRIYRAECVNLRLHCNLIKGVLDKQIDEEREYLQKVCREDTSGLFGLPHRVIPQQHIAVNISRPALQYIYMLEFHPSLALAAKIPKALSHVFKTFQNLQKPKSTGEIISMERRMLEVVQKEWDFLQPSGNDFAVQTQKDLFSEVFVEDPLFVCEVAQSLITAEENKKGGGRKSVKEKQQILTRIWSRILEVITLRHRLIMASQETSVVTKIYRRRAKEIGFDEYHAFLRIVSFDFAQTKPEADTDTVSITLIQEDDSRIDRYTPAYLPLAIQELDEKHVGNFSFRTREGFMHIVSDSGVDKLGVVLMTQICHKNIIISSLLRMDGCAAVIRAVKAKAATAEKSGGSGLSPRSSRDQSLTSRRNSVEESPSHLSAFSTKRLDREFERKMQEVFVSVQLEKTFLRDKMLNEYIRKKEQLGVTLKSIDEVVKLKRKLIMDFNTNLHKRVTQYSLQAQIVAYTTSLLDLMGDFPTTRDAHFMIGEEDEKKSEEDDDPTPDPKHFKSRPRRMLSVDGKKLMNLWFIPHYTEVMKMFSKEKIDTRNRALTVMLELVSSMHDICQYLCAHARLGSSTARLGTQKLEFSGVTADWGGTEGIGAELREIQRQINHLENPTDPYEVAEFLVKRRDNLFLEVDISVSHSVRDTFLSTGNEAAYRSITDNMHFALQDLSNLPRPNMYSTHVAVPGPLGARDNLGRELYPWRSFMQRYGPFPMMYWQWYAIGDHMQLCLAGLKEVDRHVVNGEILGVSLLLEDVLQAGLPDMFFSKQEDEIGSSTSPRSRPATSSSRRPTSRQSDTSEDGTGVSGKDPKSAETTGYGDIPKGKLSHSTNPKAAVKLINMFLLICSRLEVLKTDWGCRKLGVNEISSTKNYRAFLKLYKIDVLQSVYQQIAAKLGLGQEYAALGVLTSDDEPLATPPGATEMELKIKQLVRLLENLECSMISDVLRRISREHTLVVSERGRDDTTLPTDLWKKPVMKENSTITKPHLVENFVLDLMAGHMDDGETIEFTREHLNKCLLRLATETNLRERVCFESYAMYYESLLRHQHQLLFMREQEIKQCQDQMEANAVATVVDVHCQLADRSHEQLLEITALRAKIMEMRDSIMNQEKELREKIKKDFANLVQELFSNCFEMKNKFEEFRLFLYDDVHESLNDVRRQALEDMREKSGSMKAVGTDPVLKKCDQIRDIQEDNTNLGQMFLKMKTMNNWKKTRLFLRYHDSVDSLRDEADRAKRECLEVKKLAEEKAILMKQEQAALRQALSELEKECQRLRRKLQFEQKSKMQKMHAQIQEQQSLRQLELAKSTNIDKLISDLEEKEMRLRLLTENLDRDQRRNMFQQGQSKKTLKQMMMQLEHERSLKLGAFERVEELQRTIYGHSPSRPHSSESMNGEAPLDKRPFTSWLPAPESVSVPQRSASVMASKSTSVPGKPLGGGVWPPPVSFPRPSPEREFYFMKGLKFE
ncbi:uncharacterized protein LOC5511107 isoform X2 [Nematostella vectensis]|uniref:uncharacterized protein LOC5511107 isoform X2 n=1 Tax=Nematostella vectensis TaxID=45351 RepID=UPI002076E512|nr:uncharacterized protein LOC5511107 isoform X2 [Nematostella vectensis]